LHIKKLLVQKRKDAANAEGVQFISMLLRSVCARRRVLSGPSRMASAAEATSKHQHRQPHLQTMAALQPAVHGSLRAMNSRIRTTAVLHRRM